MYIDFTQYRYNRIVLFRTQKKKVFLDVSQNQKLKINVCVCLKQTKKCVRINDHIIKLYCKVCFSLGFLTLPLFGGVYIDALLQPYSKHLPIIIKKKVAFKIFFWSVLCFIPTSFQGEKKTIFMFVKTCKNIQYYITCKSPA